MTIYIMKKILFLFLFAPLFSMAQQTGPRFENDTLYTSGGYKIYKGLTLKLANGTSAGGYFNFIKFQKSMGRNDTYNLQNGTLLVNKLKGYKYAGPDDCNIRITGTATFANGKNAEVEILLNFERATQDFDGMASELVVPGEFKGKAAAVISSEPKTQIKTEPAPKTIQNEDLKKLMVADEIKKLFDLYQSGALTKEEYESQKKKLLERQ